MTPGSAKARRWALAYAVVLVIAGLSAAVVEQRREVRQLMGDLFTLRMQVSTQALALESASRCATSQEDGFARDNRRLGPPKAGERRLVFLGDSITEIWKVETSFAGLGLKPINRGIGGETSPLIAARVYPDVVQLRAKAMVLLAGTNDLGPKRHFRTEENLRAAVQEAGRAGIPTLLGTIPPVGPRESDAVLKNADARRINAWIKRWCADRARCEVADYHAALSNEGGFFDQRNFREGLHPNERGFERMAAELKAALARMKRRGLI